MILYLIFACFDQILSYLSFLLTSTLMNLADCCINQLTVTASSVSENQLSACDSVWDLVVRMLSFCSECGETVLSLLSTYIQAPARAACCSVLFVGPWCTFVSNMNTVVSSIVSGCSQLHHNIYDRRRHSRQVIDDDDDDTNNELNIFIKGMMISATDAVSNLIVEIGKIVSSTRASISPVRGHDGDDGDDDGDGDGGVESVNNMKQVCQQTVLSYLQSCVRVSELSFVESDERSESYCQLIDYR